MVPGHKEAYLIIFGEQEESNDKSKVRFIGKGVKQRNHNGASVSLGSKAEGPSLTGLALRCLLSVGNTANKKFTPLSVSLASSDRKTIAL